MNSREHNENEEEFLDPSALVNGLSFCVLDLETTGGDHNYDKIIEIGLVKIKERKIVDELSFLINPLIPIPDFVQRLTSIKDKDIKAMDSIDKTIPQIMDFIGDSILVAHNAAFDVPFLNSELKRAGFAELKNASLCTNLMSKYLIPEIMNSNLTYIGEIFGISHHKAHRALEDAKVTAQVLLHYLEIFVSKGINKINHLYYPRKHYELDSIHLDRSQVTSFDQLLGRLQPVKESSFFFLFKGEKGVIEQAIPLINLNSDVSFLRQVFGEVPWQTLSIQITGPFLKSLLMMNTHYSRLKDNRQKQLINFLFDYTFQYSQDGVVADINLKPLEVFYQNYFVIRKHLIPEQYVIQFIGNLSSKSELIFRYPAHQKKLQQFINYQLKRKQQKKKGRLFIHPELNLFFQTFFAREVKKVDSTEYFLFNEDLFKNKPNVFKTTLGQFIERTKHLVDYPKQHL